MPAEIGVFVLGQTVVDREAVQRWLHYLGVDDFELPEPDEITDPALLIALAGKRCYKSFKVDPALNPNITKIREDYAVYLDNILAAGHGAVAEHAVYNIAIEGITRVATAELNRHRAGWAISEGSLRYNRFGSQGIPYWLPESLRGDDVLLPQWEDRDYEALTRDPQLVAALTVPQKQQLSRRLFKEAFADQERIYRLLETLWAAELAPASKFSRKKEITSMMRRVVGMGASTGGIWTGNIRALRHVITMRAAPEAEDEIAYIFCALAKLLSEREPMLFGDFTQTPEGFWVPRYRKV